MAETHHERMLAHLHKGVTHLATHHQSIHDLMRQYIEENERPLIEEAAETETNATTPTD